MLSEIGSNFWIDPNEVLKDIPIGTPEQFGCKGYDYVWLSTGRSAISYTIQFIEECTPQLKKKAVLPSFTCHTVIEPFLKAGFDVCYYKVENDLSASTDDILKTAIEHDASIVLFHRYFGFDTLAGQVDIMCDLLRQLGKYTIEDCTQCLYSVFPKSNADFFVGSIRKWHGTPDGGFVVSRDVVLESKPIQTDLRLERAKVEASYAKYNYLFKHKGDKAAFLRMYRLAEDILSNQKILYAISKTSCELQSNLDVDCLKGEVISRCCYLVLPVWKKLNRCLMVLPIMLYRFIFRYM